MMRTALERYRELEPLAPLALRPRPQLLLAPDPAQPTLAEQHARALRGAGLEAELLDGRHPRREWPALALDIAGGLLVGESWLLDPAAATPAFAAAAREAGARTETGVRVVAVPPDRVLTDRGRMDAEIVVAAGPWPPDLVPGLPISAGRGWRLRAVPLPGPIPWVVEEMSWPAQDRLGRLARPLTLGELVSGGRPEPAASALAAAPLPGRGGADRHLAQPLAPRRGRGRRDAPADRRAGAALLARTGPAAGGGRLERPLPHDPRRLAGGRPHGRRHLGARRPRLDRHAGGPAIVLWLAEPILTGEGGEAFSGLGPERFRPQAPAARSQREAQRDSGSGTS
jgi:hypothetical protein